MAKTRKQLEVEADKIGIPAAEIKSAKTNADIQKMLDDYNKGKAIMKNATSKEVEAPPIEDVKKKDLKPPVSPSKVEDGEEVIEEATPIETDDKGELKEGLETKMPLKHTIVYGGPVIKGVKHPFGFSVVVQSNGEDGVYGKEMEFGVGKGVALHGVQNTPAGIVNTYAIIY